MTRRWLSNAVNLGQDGIRFLSLSRFWLRLRATINVTKTPKTAAAPKETSKPTSNIDDDNKQQMQLQQRQ